MLHLPTIPPISNYYIPEIKNSLTVITITTTVIIFALAFFRSKIQQPTTYIHQQCVIKNPLFVRSQNNNIPSNLKINKSAALKTLD